MYCTYSEDVHGPAVLMPVWLGEMQIVEGRFREVEPWLIVLGYKGLVLRYIVGPREAQLLLNILTRNLTPSFLVTEQLRIANTKSLWKGNVYNVYFPTNTKVINVNLYFAKNICWDILHLRINQIIKKQLYNYPVNRCVNNNYFQ